MPLTIQQFASRIKSKYPDYAGIDDNVLVKQIVAKYPDYAPMVDMGRSGATRDFGETEQEPVATNYEEAAAPRQSALPPGAPAGQQAAAMTGDALSFAGRAIAASPVFLGALHGSGGDIDYALKEFYKDLGKRHADHDGVGGVIENMERDPSSLVTLPVGGIAGKAVGAITKAVVPNVVARVAAKTGAWIGGGALEGAPAATTHQLENVAEGKNVDISQTGKDLAASAAMSTAMGTSAEILAKGLKATALQTMKAFLRPGKTGAREGFKAENIFKHNLDAPSLEGMAQKTGAKLDDLNNQLDNIRGLGSDGTVTVDVPAAFYAAMRKLKLVDNKATDTEVSSHIFDEDQMRKIFQDEILPTLKKNAAEGDVTLAKAMRLKTITGNKAAEYGAYNRMGDKNAKVPGDVYDAVTEELRNQINSQIKKYNLGDIDKINKDFEEVIPIMKAIIRRNPTLKSNLPISLHDLGEAGVGATTAGEDAGAWDKTLRAIGFALAGKVLSNPKTTGIMYKTGKALGAPGPVKAAFGAAARQGVRSNLLQDLPINNADMEGGQ